MDCRYPAICESGSTNNCLQLCKLVINKQQAYSLHFFTALHFLNLCFINEIWRFLSRRYVHEARRKKSADKTANHGCRTRRVFDPGICRGFNEYHMRRARFFYSNPVYQGIFSEAVLSPPVHLRDEIQKCRLCFDSLNIQILERLLMSFSLRQGISKDEVIEIFRQF